MRIDLPTLFMAIGFTTEVAGLLLLFSWFQERRATTLAYWGAAYAIGAIGGLLFCAQDFLPQLIATDIGGALVLGAYGLMWCGARTFEGRKPLLALALMGAAMWFVLGASGFLQTHAYPRIVMASSVMTGYVLLTASEYWRARDKELMSRWPAILLLLIHASFFVFRMLFAEMLPFPGGMTGIRPGWVPVGMFAMLLNNFCMAFLVMNMTKERLEREQRRAALIDPLTGVANRRAFLERGERLLQRAAAEASPVALLLFDLDWFKQINDTFGHQTGDRILCVFCDVAGMALRPTDVLGRIGGEEFACLLPGATVAEATLAAERIRTRFASHPMVASGAHAVPATVSIGIAIGSDADYSLTTLLASADRALYQAKAKGRNRIERAWPEVAMAQGLVAGVA